MTAVSGLFSKFDSYFGQLLLQKKKKYTYIVSKNKKYFCTRCKTGQKSLHFLPDSKA
jgi:hypothetical protein